MPVGVGASQKTPSSRPAASVCLGDKRPFVASPGCRGKNLPRIWRRYQFPDSCRRTCRAEPVNTSHQHERHPPPGLGLYAHDGVQLLQLARQDLGGSRNLRGRESHRPGYAGPVRVSKGEVDPALRGGAEVRRQLRRRRAQFGSGLRSTSRRAQRSARHRPRGGVRRRLGG